MQFTHIPNAAVSQESDRPLMQKEVYPVSNVLQHYLQQFKHDHPLPVSYKALLHYDYTNAIKDENGKHTHWERVIYKPADKDSLYLQLTQLYQQLKKINSIDGWQVATVDFCEFANSMPFRINMQHTGDGSTDCYYIKAADASRIYGLELEHLLTSNHINFIYHDQTLVEEHIDGIPGDAFISNIAASVNIETALLAEAFVRFNERCFVRLLGDMRSYNFVVIQNADAAHPFTIRAIDFDQQCYEGRLNLYLPQFYKENLLYVEAAMNALGTEKIEQIRLSERRNLALLASRKPRQLSALLHALLKEEISENYKIVSLRKELNHYHHTQRFSRCKTMGCIVKQQLKQLLQPYLRLKEGTAATI